MKRDDTPDLFSWQPQPGDDEATIAARFAAFHRGNPRVYALYKRFAREAIEAGLRRLSSDFICHRIRWETSVVTKGAGWNDHEGRPFKINDHYTAHYARLFVSEHPEYEDYFVLRELRTE